MLVYAPWTQEQVDSANGYQQNGQFHQYVCADPFCPGKPRLLCEHGVDLISGYCDKHPRQDWDMGEIQAERQNGKPTGDTLIARIDGWYCPSCGYTQTWAHDWTLNWSWKRYVNMFNK